MWGRLKGQLLAPDTIRDKVSKHWMGDVRLPIASADETAMKAVLKSGTFLFTAGSTSLGMENRRNFQRSGFHKGLG